MKHADLARERVGAVVCSAVAGATLDEGAASLHRAAGPALLADVERAGGCKGLQLDFPAQQIHGVAEVWVPFEASIAIGWG